MLINGVEVSRNNLQDWSITALRKMQKTLSGNLDKHVGDEKEERILMRLMTVEIKRQVKIENINLAAKAQAKKAIKEVENSAWKSQSIGTLR